MVLPSRATSPSAPYVAVSVRDVCYLFLWNATHHAQKFTETKGHPGESVAERWLGRDGFEGKDSHVINMNDVTHLKFSRRRSWPSQWMHLSWRRCHSVLWNKIVSRVYYHPQLAKIYDACLFWIVRVIVGVTPRVPWYLGLLNLNAAIRYLNSNLSF